MKLMPTKKMKMKLEKSKIAKSLDVFKLLIKKGGPQKSDYNLLKSTIEELGKKLKSEEITKDDLKELYALFDDEFIQNTIAGHSLRKPYGYAGDFMIIDKVYQYSICKKYKLWDEYSHNQIAVQAVRNRKEYFKEIMQIEHENRKGFSLLNLASGPARDLLELYEKIENPTIETYCIEYDPHAIKYAMGLTKKYNNLIEYENANIYKFDCDKKFDVIWSAGLFDYFDDKTFVKILKKILNWTNEGYEIILGNLKSNPSRYYLEVLGEWYLHYRDEKDLIKLANQAGISNDRIEIKQEKAGVNLFIHIKGKKADTNKA